MSAAADGVLGGFEIDTGSSTALVLQRAFVDKYGFEARHPGALRLKAGGIDGVFETIATRLDRFEFARFRNRAPRCRIPFEQALADFRCLALMGASATKSSGSS